MNAETEARLQRCGAHPGFNEQRAQAERDQKQLYEPHNVHLQTVAIM